MIFKTHSNQNQFAKELSKALLSEGGFPTKFQILALTIPETELIQKKSEKNVILSVCIFHSMDTQKMAEWFMRGFFLNM